MLAHTYTHFGIVHTLYNVSSGDAVKSRAPVVKLLLLKPYYDHQCLIAMVHNVKMIPILEKQRLIFIYIIARDAVETVIKNSQQFVLFIPLFVFPNLQLSCIMKWNTFNVEKFIFRCSGTVIYRDAVWSSTLGRDFPDRPTVSRVSIEGVRGRSLWVSGNIGF